MAFQGVWLIQPGNPEPHKVPDQPGVIAYFEGRGWQVTNLPADLDADDPEFIQAREKLQNQDEAESKPAKTKKSAEAKSATESKEDE